MVLAAEAAELNVSFVPLCPEHWREVGRAEGGHSLLRICFAHSPGIGGRELQAHKSLKSLLQSSWAARAPRESCVPCGEKASCAPAEGLSHRFPKLLCCALTICRLCVAPCGALAWWHGWGG